jgi:hypothetical protein
MEINKNAIVFINKKAFDEYKELMLKDIKEMAKRDFNYVMDNEIGVEDPNKKEIINAIINKEEVTIVYSFAIKPEEDEKACEEAIRNLK